MIDDQREFEVFLESYFQDDCFKIKDIIENKTPSGQYRDISVRWMLSAFLASRGKLNPLREAKHDFNASKAEENTLELERIAHKTK